jgi:hypothetical protein
MKSNLKKYSIDDFFVGELCVSFSPNNKNDKINQAVINELIKDLRLGGAIDLGRESDYKENNIDYRRYLALFLKYGDSYICLNANNLNLNNGIDYCKNTVLLRNCLPQIGYNIPNNIDIRGSLILFNTLFKRTAFRSPISLYTRYSFDTDAYFSSNVYFGGTLNLYTGYKSDGKYELSNLADEYLLKAIGTKEGKTKEINVDEKIHIYKEYFCLFLIRQKQEILNLCNNQYYKFGTNNNEKTDIPSVLLGKSYHESMLQFNKYVKSIGKNNYICGKTYVREALTKFIK